MLVTKISPGFPPSGKSIQVKVYRSETHQRSVAANWPATLVTTQLNWTQKWSEELQMHIIKQNIQRSHGARAAETAGELRD